MSKFGAFWAPFILLFPCGWGDDCKCVLGGKLGSGLPLPFAFCTICGDAEFNCCTGGGSLTCETFSCLEKSSCTQCFFPFRIFPFMKTEKRRQRQESTERSHRVLATGSQNEFQPKVFLYSSAQDQRGICKTGWIDSQLALFDFNTDSGRVNLQ